MEDLAGVTFALDFEQGVEFCWAKEWNGAFLVADTANRDKESPM